MHNDQAVTGVSSLETFGVARHFDVGVRFSVSAERLSTLTRSLEVSLLAHPEATARLVGFGLHRTDIDLTVAVSLGTTEDVVGGTTAARVGLDLLAHLVTDLADFLPALRELPAPTSDEALVADALRDGEALGSLPAPVAVATRALVAAIG